MVLFNVYRARSYAPLGMIRARDLRHARRIAIKHYGESARVSPTVLP